MLARRAELLPRFTLFMSIKNNTNTTADTTNCTYTISNESETNGRCSFSTRDNGRTILREPGGEMLNVARLTAYVEHGEDIFGKDVHHEIPGYKVDIPEFLQPMSRSEHASYHGVNPEPELVDGVPLLRPEGAEQ